MDVVSSVLATAVVETGAKGSVPGGGMLLILGLLSCDCFSPLELLNHGLPGVSVLERALSRPGSRESSLFLPTAITGK